MGSFAREDAIRLLSESAPSQSPVSSALAGRAFDVVGGNPFYLQLLGEALTRQPTRDEDSSLKQGLQDLLFSRTGRLALYFENEFQRLVGRSGYLAKTLEALANGPLRLTEIAKEIQSPTGATARYLERLKDAVARTQDIRLDLSISGLSGRVRPPGDTRASPAWHTGQAIGPAAALQCSCLEADGGGSSAIRLALRGGGRHATSREPACSTGSRPGQGQEERDPRCRSHDRKSSLMGRSWAPSATRLRCLPAERGCVVEQKSLLDISRETRLGNIQQE